MVFHPDLPEAILFPHSGGKTINFQETHSAKPTGVFRTLSNIKMERFTNIADSYKRLIIAPSFDV